MKKLSKKHIAHLSLIASIAPHLFCCVLPTVLAVLSLIAPAGDTAHLEIIPESWMPFVFVVSGLMLAISYYLVWKPECDCDCTECHTEHHRTEKIILGVATILFVLSITLHILGH